MKIWFKTVYKIEILKFGNVILVQIWSLQTLWCLNIFENNNRAKKDARSSETPSFLLIKKNFTLYTKLNVLWK